MALFNEQGFAIAEVVEQSFTRGETGLIQLLLNLLQLVNEITLQQRDTKRFF